MNNLLGVMSARELNSYIWAMKHPLTLHNPNAPMSAAPSEPKPTKGIRSFLDDVQWPETQAATPINKEDELAAVAPPVIKNATPRLPINKRSKDRPSKNWSVIIKLFLIARNLAERNGLTLSPNKWAEENGIPASTFRKIRREFQIRS